MNNISNHVFEDFKKAVDADSVELFNTAVVRFLKNSPGQWVQQVNGLSVGLYQLNKDFQLISNRHSTRYKNLHLQWLQSDFVDPNILEELFFSQYYPAWEYLLQQQDHPKYFNNIDISRLFHPQRIQCLHPQSLKFLTALKENNSINCFKHFLHHDFVLPIFLQPPVDGTLNWVVTSAQSFDFFTALWDFYAEQLDTIELRWVWGLIGAAKEREDGSLLEHLMTDERFQKWIETSDVFHTALLEYVWFDLNMYSALLNWLPEDHHFAVRRSVVINKNLQMNPEEATDRAFVAHLPVDERIDHFVEAWNRVSQNHHNQEVRERKYVVPAIECFSDDDIDRLIQHPWMETAGMVVRTTPKIQQRLIVNAVSLEGKGAKNILPVRKKI